MRSRSENPFRLVHNRLLAHFGPQRWWPADSPFEVMVGAILTQNTAWSNVEKAIANLLAAGSLSAEAIVQAPHDRLAGWIRPSGYFNIKTVRLKNFCQWYLEQGGFDALQAWETQRLRHGLLSVNGVGPETADDMLLYAFERDIFVVDAYTRRLFSRLGIIDGDPSYEALRHQVENAFARDKQRVAVFNELHALIVAHAKTHCRKRPGCAGCPLQANCGVMSDERDG